MQKLLLAVFVAGAASTGSAEAQTRFEIRLDGALAASGLDYDGTRVYPEAQESVRVQTRYSAESAAGFEVGLRFDVTPAFGVAVTLGRFVRDVSGDASASVPHPFHFDRDRALAGSVGGLTLDETVGHFDLVYSVGAGALELSVFGGLSAFKVEAELVTRVDYAHAYPYDEATLTGLPAATFDDSPLGFNVGLGLDYAVSTAVGLGARARFARASATLGPDADNRAEVDVGGLQLAAGVRIRF